MLRKILVTDDNQTFAENLAETLKDAGYEAVIAVQAERIPETYSMQVILSDF